MVQLEQQDRLVAARFAATNFAFGHIAKTEKRSMATISDPGVFSHRWSDLRLRHLLIQTAFSLNE